MISSLATLAWAGYRHPYFRDQLIEALLILQQEKMTRDEMVGSWAGAMGQPQFMPSSFLEFSVDFSGDGRRDIWKDVPDVLASISNYLKEAGWGADLPWGFEVSVPKDLDLRVSRDSFQGWSKRGLRRSAGGSFPKKGDAILFFPSGAGGPAFLVTRNFEVIKRYNNSDVFALAVAHLADRLRGEGPIRESWPRLDQQLTQSQRIRLQQALAKLGYGVSNFQGQIDFDLRDSIRSVQVKIGEVPDGHPTPAFLDKLERMVP